ncbi:MAG: protein disulfide oxidoreductase [Campylobacterota bacterium]|nr:protein disulfide oxidoreductase [Campylobacterota bacterium]
MFKKFNLKKIAKEIAIMGITLFIVMNIISYLRSPKLSDTSLPNITSTLIDNTHYSSLNQSKKPLLIHFWATWCPTCKLEAGNIQKISEDFNVLTVAVKSGSDTEIRDYIKENNFDFKVINDSQGILSSQFSVPAFPTTFIYNSQGKLEFTEVGYTSILGLYARMLWVQ